MIKLRVYEYTIKNKQIGNYTGSYTIKAGCPNEEKLAKEYKATMVDEFELIK